MRREDSDGRDRDGTVPGLAETVRLTPYPTRVSGVDKCRRSLNGKWRFHPDPPETFPAGDTDTSAWEPLTVPGEWGRGRTDVSAERPVGYSRRIRVPDQWNETRVILRFDAVYSHATVWIDGERIGSHEGAYTPFEFDVTDSLTAGTESVLSVAVTEDSVASRMAVQHPCGGITRGVSLFAVPEVFVSRFHVDTNFDADTRQGTIHGLLEVTNERSSLVEESHVRVTARDPSGERVAIARRTIGSLEPGESRQVDTDLSLEDPQTWDPEHPNLYDVVCELHSGHSLERTTRQAGVRKIEVDGNRLRLNGTAISLRGVNRHEVHPASGRSVPARITWSDVEQFKAANVNYIRTSHYPPSEALLEACDELGIVVEEEAPFHHLWQDDLAYATDPKYKNLVVRQTAEMAERDLSHPSICLWSLGNESAWGANFDAAARYLEAIDPSRPRTFNQDKYHTQDHDVCQVGNHHYPETRPMESGLGRVASFEGHDRPILFGEYAHTYCYNEHELAADPGLRDEWGRVLETIWERIYEIDACVGGAIWAGIDDSVYERVWGLLDEWRRPKPEYWHVKKVYSPVRLASSKRVSRDGESVLEVELENRFDFTNVRTCRFEWDAGSTRGTATLDVPPGETGVISIPLPAVDGQEPTLRVVHPDGRVLNRFAFPVDEMGSETNTPVRAGGLDLEQTDDAVTIRGSSGKWSINNSGRLTACTLDGTTVVQGGPHLAVAARELFEGTSSDPEQDPLGETLTGWTCHDVRLEETADGVEVVVDGEYEQASGAFHYRFLEDDHLELQYRFTATEPRDVREVGVVFDLVSEFDTLAWTRDAYWSTYPEDHIGRPSGIASAFDVGCHTDAARRGGPSWSWNKDLVPGGMIDFCGSKHGVQTASLTAQNGVGMAINSSTGLDDHEYHVRASACSDRVRVLIGTQWLVGSGPSFLDRPYGLRERQCLEQGDGLTGTVVIRLFDKSQSASDYC